MAGREDNSLRRLVACVGLENLFIPGIPSAWSCASRWAVAGSGTAAIGKSRCFEVSEK
jgi:hypothetical protein